MTRTAIAPIFTAGPTGLDPYRPWSVVTIDGVFFSANGYDAPKRWNGTSAWYPMGSVAPSDFTLALSSAGSPAAIPTGQTATYYLVGHDPVLGKETAPQASNASIANSSGATRDVTVAWTPGSLSVEFTNRRIYRRLNGSDTFKLVATVLDSAGTYLDVTPDATLRSNAAYVYTYRTTLPPTFIGLSVVQNRMWGWERGNSVAKYAQPVSAGSLFVADDFKSSYLWPVGPNDAQGDIIDYREYYGTAIWYKERARYEQTGSDISTWDVRRLAGDRGALSQRAILDINGRLLVLDQRGLYWDTPGVDPIVAGARPYRPNPYAPTWARLNLAVKRSAFMLHDPENQIVYVFVALDHDPVPAHAVIYDYERDIFIGTDTVQWGTAGGTLIDASGRVHVVFGCDMGFLWEPGIGASQGITAGDTSGVVTAVTLGTITAGAASFGTVALTGVIGTPLRRYATATPLTSIDDNRVQSATSTVLTTRFYATAAVGTSETVQVGIIPGLARTPATNIETHELKFVDDMIVEHGSGVSVDLYVEYAFDAGALAQTSVTCPLSTTIRDYVPISGNCWRVSIQLSQFQSGGGFEVDAIHLSYQTLPGNRNPNGL